MKEGITVATCRHTQTFPDIFDFRYGNAAVLLLSFLLPVWCIKMPGKLAIIIS